MPDVDLAPSLIADLGLKALSNLEVTLTTLAAAPETVIDLGHLAVLRTHLDSTRDLLLGKHAGSPHSTDRLERVLEHKGDGGATLRSWKRCKHAMKVLDALYGPQPG